MRIDRNSVSGNRDRRNFQRLSVGTATAEVALNPTGGVENTSTGLALDFIGEGSLLTIGSTGAVTFLPVGSTGQVLTVSSTSSTDLAWETPSGGGTGGPFLPLAGGTMSGTIDMGDQVINNVAAINFFPDTPPVAGGTISVDPATLDMTVSAGGGYFLYLEAPTVSVDTNIFSLNSLNAFLQSDTSGNVVFNFFSLQLSGLPSTSVGGVVLADSTGVVGFLPDGSAGQVLTQLTSTTVGWSTGGGGGGGSTFFVEAGNSGISTSTVGTSTFVYNTSTGAGVYLPLAGGTMTGAIDFGQLVFTYFIEPTTSFPDSGFSGSGEWGTVFDFNSAGFVKGGAFYKQIGNTGTHSLSMWNYDTSAFLASTLFTGETAAGWQTQNFTTPIPVVPGVNYMIAYGSSTGHNSQASGFFAPSTSPNGYINIKTHGSGGESGFNGTIGTLPTAGAPNDYGVDVLFELTSTGTQASITADGSGDLILNGTSVELSTSMFLNGNTLVLDSTNSNLVGDGFGDLFISANNNIVLEATAIILQGTVLLEEVILDVATLAVPSITKGAALGGTGATASFQGTEFFDNAGTIRLKPGLLTSTGILATVTFGVGFPFGAFFTLSPANALAAGLGTTTQVFISAASATQFVITSGSAPLAVGSTYEFTYVGIGF